MVEQPTDQDVAYQPMIRDIPQSERPRERLNSYGASALSTSELLAILLRTGVTGENVIHLAMRLLSEYSGLSGLAKASATAARASPNMRLAGEKSPLKPPQARVSNAALRIIAFPPGLGPEGSQDP